MLFSISSKIISYNSYCCEIFIFRVLVELDDKLKLECELDVNLMELTKNLNQIVCPSMCFEMAYF